MFGIKKKGRHQAAKLHRLLGEYFAPYIAKAANNMRLKGRVRLFRRWGRNNPKKVVSAYAVFAVIVLGWNLLGFVGINHLEHTNDTDPLNLKQISSATNPFDGMTEINRNRENIKDAISDLAKSKARLAHRFDSLYNLKEKSKRDSLEILRIYKTITTKRDNNNEP